METGHLFDYGDSQAVLLPKEIRLPGHRVRIRKAGKRIILEPAESIWDAWQEALFEFPDDFMQDGRHQPEMQHRQFLSCRHR